MSLRSSTWRMTSRQSHLQADTTAMPSTVALNFCLALTNPGIKIWSEYDLNIKTDKPLSAGRGAFALVERGETPDKTPIVVKKSLRLAGLQYADQSAAFSTHLRQLCLELRVMTHQSIRNHPNIVDILGICAESSSGDPSISLVLEFASLGTLHTFLSETSRMKNDAVLDCASQILNGLEALHDLRICHGDIKTRNILVFSQTSKLVYKVADFGSCIAALTEDNLEEVGIPYGTPLYNAPEIRHWRISGLRFTIFDAISTDVFSFGLLIWEIALQGPSFFEGDWLNGGGESYSVEEWVERLANLEHNQLLDASLAYLAQEELHLNILSCLRQVLRGSLQDHPEARLTTRGLKMLLDRPQRCSAGYNID
ncbi:kinase-like protein [Polyplosphaeria fusca]|uniref:non-specific serine/threonine protein kinase n=1 Tax=Polyplosphaeria fusca TaxID=682080 RepID=A0A9P4V2L7_9PLEO|nr:kinase-like protein [Polyplosphaeria fusca]